ncbi:hypothetical protein J3F84DRAFT_376272 [Trichoderma pleuroticola]
MDGRDATATSTRRRQLRLFTPAPRENKRARSRFPDAAMQDQCNKPALGQQRARCSRKRDDNSESQRWNAVANYRLIVSMGGGLETCLAGGEDEDRPRLPLPFPDQQIEAKCCTNMRHAVLVECFEKDSSRIGNTLAIFLLQIFLFVARNRVPSRSWDSPCMQDMSLPCGGCICRDMDFELSSALWIGMESLLLPHARSGARLIPGLDAVSAASCAFLASIRRLAGSYPI